MNKKVAQYIRVSTHQQTTENQKRELDIYCKRQGWRVVQVYDDSGFSGAKNDRPALNDMLKDAVQGRFDILCVWKIDRLARSTADLLNILTQLKTAGIDFCSITQAIDTSTSYGKMVMTFLGAIAEFERETIVERVKSGIARARANNVRLGRPRIAFDVRKAMELRQEGRGYKDIAKQLGIPRTTLFRTLRAIPKTPA